MQLWTLKFWSCLFANNLIVATSNSTCNSVVRIGQKKLSHLMSNWEYEL
jgi:hypothetical protein